MKIKICGIKTLSEARAVCECEFRGKRVDFIGLIFAPSKRQVSTEIAEQIANLAKSYGVKAVGVFKDLAQAKSVAKMGFLDAVQVYSKVDSKAEFAPCEVWQVFSVNDALPELEGDFDLALFDYKGKELGGNGLSFEWGILDGLSSSGIPFGIAGGLSEQNAKKASEFAPALLDFNSKLEDEKGFKIPEKIAKLLENIYKEAK